MSDGMCNIEETEILRWIVVLYINLFYVVLDTPGMKLCRFNGIQTENTMFSLNCKISTFETIKFVL